MKGKFKKKNERTMLVRIGAVALVVFMLAGVVFSTVGTQTTHSHTYTEEELAALQALLDATGEDHSDHGHSAEELQEMLDDAEEADGEADADHIDDAEDDHDDHDEHDDHE